MDGAREEGSGWEWQWGERVCTACRGRGLIEVFVGLRQVHHSPPLNTAYHLGETPAIVSVVMTVVLVNSLLSSSSPPPPIFMAFHDLDGFSWANLLVDTVEDRLARPVAGMDTFKFREHLRYRC